MRECVSAEGTPVYLERDERIAIAARQDHRPVCQLQGTSASRVSGAAARDDSRAEHGPREEGAAACLGAPLRQARRADGSRGPRRRVSRGVKSAINLKFFDAET